MITACTTPGGAGVDAATSTNSVAASTGDALQTSVPEGHYRNPVFEPIFADPSIVRAEDGLFYAFATEDDWGDGQGPRPIPVIRSDDLVSWEHVGEAFAPGDSPDWKPAYLWAPDVAHVDGRYVLYYSLSLWGDANPGVGVATAHAPQGPYEDHGKLFDSEDIGVPNSIDPMLLDAGDSLLLFWGSFHGIYGIELAPDGLSVVGDKFKVAGDAFEAPYVIERDGRYVFFGSTGTCCDGADSTYAVAVGRADSPRGPYVDADGVDLRDGGGTQILGGNDAFVGPGHNSVVQDDAGTDWLVYHAIDPEQPTAMSGAQRRPLMLDEITWVDGWPTIADDTPSSEPRKAPVTDPRGPNQEESP